MNILPNKKAFPYQCRLEFVLDFLLARLSQADNSGIKVTFSQDFGALVFSIKYSQVVFPLEVNWLKEENLIRRPEGDLGHMDGNWWETFFFYLSLSDRKIHESYDRHGRWIAPRADDFWPDRKEPFLDQAKELFWHRVTEETGFSFSFEGSYTPILSVDVDQWYAYKHKPLLRNLGGLGRDILHGQFARALDRVLVVLGSRKDPYDKLGYMQGKASEAAVHFEAFILPPARSRYDKQVELPASILRKKLDDMQDVGLHPSYFVHENAELLRAEKTWLENVLKRSISSLRYHFIRGKIGEAESMAIDAGFMTNMSLVLTHGYGFPNGTCHPFRYWDHQSSSPTELIMVPQIAMDVSLKDYSNLDSLKAQEVLASLIHHCKKYKGVASIIWHNSSFNPYEGWTGYDEVFENTLNIMSAKNNA